LDPHVHEPELVIGHQIPGVVGDPLGRRLRIGGEVLQRHALGPQETAGAVLLVQGAEMTLEDHPVEHRQTADDPIPMNILERAVAHLPRTARAESHAPDAKAQAGFDGPTPTR
jgi:hypothetical protein